MKQVFGCSKYDSNEQNWANMTELPLAIVSSLCLAECKKMLVTLGEKFSL